MKRKQKRKARPRVRAKLVGGTPMQQAILDRLAELGKSRYWLAQELHLKNLSGVYGFLTRPGTGAEMVGRMAAAVGLSLTVEETK